MAERIESVETGFDDVTAEVKDLKDRVVSNERNLDAKIDQALERKAKQSGILGAGPFRYDMSRLTTKDRRRIREGPSVSAAGPVESSRESMKEAQEAQYWIARRSLRLWPIVGPDLYDATVDFLRDKLKQDPRTIGSRDELHVRPAGTIGRAKSKDEVIIRFPDATTRDAVRSAAFNLAGSSAGMRLEIPDNLRPSLRALESVSYNLKKAHPGLKRNVKFDDEVMDLVLDIKLDDSSQWRKIRPQQAMTVKLSLPGKNDDSEVDSNELHGMMSGSVASGANATPQGP